MNKWFTYLKQGLARSLPKEQITADNECGSIKAGLENLRSFIGPHLQKFLLGLALIMLSSLFSFPQPLITRYIIDDVILGRNLGLLLGAIILLIGITLAARLMELLEEFYFARFEQKVMLDLQENLIERTFRFPKSFFDDHQTGYLMSRLSSNVEELRWFFSGTIVYIISNLLRFTGGLLFLFYLEWRLAIAVTAVIPVLVVCIYFFSDRIHVLSHHEMEQDAQIASRFQEFLSATTLMKAFSSERRSAGRLIRDLKNAVEISIEQVTVSSVASLVINLMPGIVRVTVLAFGAYRIIKGEWTLGSLLAFQAYLGYVFGPAQYLASTNVQLQRALAALQRVSALFQIVPETSAEGENKVEKLKGEVEFRGVSFSYDGQKRVLENISFHVQPGEKIAVVGPSGVGKTTLISLILGFYIPVEGKIFFDGELASNYDVGSLRERLGYVSQQTLLLSGSVRENISYGNPSAGTDEIINAAKVADCYDYIAALPEGFETEIGEKGVKLSEGGKQRLALARALVKDPDILILDEPTAALDSLTERSIFDAIPELVKGKTLFIVAHRLSTIQESDRILLLKENRLVAVGTHMSLIETDDYYRSMFEYQQVGSKVKIK